VAGGSGVSSLSSIVAYGLSSVYGGKGISSLSSIISYGLSTVSGGEGISSLSSIVAYGLSTVASGEGLSSLSSIVSYGLSSVYGGEGISSLSSIVAYGLSSVAAGEGVSSLSSIVSYGLSSVSGGHGVSSLSSILSYALSSIYGGEGISSLSSIVSYGLSSVSGGQGISSLSSILSYGLSTVAGGRGISSLSSIVAYGLSTVSGGHGLSSLSSIVSYGLSSVSGGQGISSLSSILSYGLSTVSGGHGISSLSSIVSYGLSSVYGGEGISSLSSIVAYGLSSIRSNVEEIRRLVGDASGILGSNTWNPDGFYSDNVGGAGIRDINNAPTDTVTNAIAKLDTWIYKNIVDQPNAPSYFAQSNSITSINYYWTNPKQFKIGLLNTYAPYISSLHMNLYSNVGSIPGLFSTFSYSDPNIPYSGLTIEGVEFASTNSNSVINVYKDASFSNKNTIRIPIDVTKFNPINGPYSLDLYFRNYSSNAYKILQFGQNQLGNVGPPGAPRQISFTNIFQSNAFIVITEPLLYSTNPDLSSYPRLSNYRISLSNTAGARRYNNPVFIASNIFTNSIFSYIRPIQSNFLGNILKPDFSYIAIVSASNILNSNYGAALESSVFQTLLPDQPRTLTSITALSNGNSNTKLVFGNISNVIVYNTFSFGVGNGLQFTTNSGLGIHSSNNPGSSNSNIASITLIVTGPTGSIDSNTLNLNGYPIMAATSNNSNANTIIQASNIVDFYPRDLDQSNFFMSFTANATLKESYLTASSNPYRFSMIHSNSVFNCNFNYSNNFYIDDLRPGPPSLTNVTISLSRIISYSGVPSNHNIAERINENGIEYLNPILFNFDLSNLARYVFIKDQNLLTGSINYKGEKISDINNNINHNYNNTYLYTEQNTIQNTAPLSNISIIKSGFSIPPYIFTEANSDGSRVSIKIFLSNLNGSNIVERPLPFYFDTLSRINFQKNPIPRTSYLYPGGLYDDTALIISNVGNNNYNIELPYVGGLYRTGCNLSNLYDSFSNFQPLNSYSRLSNYSFIKNETITRYANFYINYSSPNIQTYINKVTINFSNQFGLVLINSNYNNLVVTDFIAYRGMDADVRKYDTITISNIRSNISPFSGSNGTRPDFSITSNSRTISIPPYNSTSDRRFYIEIGLKMNCNVSFECISVQFGSNFAPPFPANVTLSNTDRNLTLRWQTPANCNSPLDNYTFNIIPICNATYPRRFVQSGSRIIQEPYFSNVICNIFIPNISPSYVFTRYQYSNLASNYDTPYIGQVSLTNDAATSGFSNSLEIITALPSNNGSEFAGTLRPSGLAVNYIYNGISFANRSGPIIANTLIYASNLLFSNNVSRQFITNSNITVNPQDGYIGFRNNTTVWEIQLCNITLGQTLRSISYPFGTSFFGSSSSQDITNSTNDGCIFLLSNIRDMYSNDTYTSGFYLLATPVVALSNIRIPPSSNLYRLSLTDSSRFITNFLEFYVDNLVGSPSGRLDVENTGDITFCNICGVSVITSTRFNFWITTTNIGNHFFYNPPVTASIGNMSGTFSFDSVNTPFYWNNNTGSTYTRAPISNTTYFYWSNVQVANSNFRTTYPITGTVSNIATTTGVSLGGGSFTPYFDFESIPLMALPRVYSGLNDSGYPASGTFGATYDHTKNLINQYGYELQLSKGAFRSPYAPLVNSYLNYAGTYFTPNGGINLPNYSGFSTAIFRFVTFKYPINTTNTSNKVDLLSLTIQWADATPSISGSSYDSDAFQFRIRFNSNSPTQLNDTSEWLPILSNISPRRTIDNKSNQSDTLGVASNVVNLVTGSNPRYTIAVPDGCGYGNFDVYARMGLKTGSYNTGFSLSNILVTRLSEINVTSQFNFTCNTVIPTTTIRFTTPQGLPSITYYRLSNILYNSINEIVQITNTLMSPLSNSYTIASESVPGSYSNNTNIYSASGSLFWTGSYRFSIISTVVPPPILVTADNNYINGDSYNINARIYTIFNGGSTNLQTYYNWSGGTRIGPTTFTTSSAIIVSPTYTEFNNGCNTLTMCNYNPDTTLYSIISNVSIVRPMFVPTPPIAPSFSRITFSQVSFTRLFTVSSSNSGVDGITYYTWNPGGASSNTTTSGSINLSNQTATANFETTYTLSGSNVRDSVNNSATASAPSSKIYYNIRTITYSDSGQPIAIPANAIRPYVNFSDATNFQVNGGAIAVRAGFTITLRRTDENSDTNSSSLYVYGWYIHI